MADESVKSERKPETPADVPPYHTAETWKIAQERESALNAETDGAETDGNAE